MRKLLTALAGVALVAGLATTYGDSTRDDRPSEGRSHYDKRQHDDPSILF